MRMKNINVWGHKLRCIDVFYGSGGKADKREKTTIETKVGEPGFSIVGGFGFPFAREWGMV